MIINFLFCVQKSQINSAGIRTIHENDIIQLKFDKLYSHSVTTATAEENKHHHRGASPPTRPLKKHLPVTAKTLNKKKNETLSAKLARSVFAPPACVCIQ